MDTIVAKASARSDKCYTAMKAFLCTLYNRPCNTTGGLVQPICLADCESAYSSCGFSNRYKNLQCGELIKAGWVAYKSDTVYGTRPNGKADWNTGDPSCSKAMLRPDTSLSDFLGQNAGPFAFITGPASRSAAPSLALSYFFLGWALIYVLLSTMFV